MKQQVMSDPVLMRELITEYVPGATAEQAEKLTRFYVMLI